MKTQIVPIGSIRENPDNPRVIKDDKFKKLVASVREFPEMLQIRPIVVNADRVVLGGNMRLKACSAAGLKEVPIIVASELTEEQQREFIIKDNVSGGEWDWGDLSTNWDMDLLDAWGLDLPEIKATEDTVGDDDAPQVQESPVTVLGDVWSLGAHRLICGDSTSIDVVMTLMGDELADQIVTDPPYNVAYEGKTKGKLKIDNDSMGADEFREFLRGAFTAAVVPLKPGGAFYIWHADSEGFNFRAACADVGLKVRQCLIWVKNSMVMGRQDYQWKHEPCLYGWKDGAGHLWASDRKQTTVLNFDRPNRNGEHPTMKPVELFAYCIENNTKGGDIVLDPFGGSGTTVIACEKLGRRARTIELDPRYCDVIVRRFINFCAENDRNCVVKLNGEAYDGRWTTES